MGTEARYRLRVDYNEMSAKITTLVTALKAKVSARAEQYYHQSAEIIHPLKDKLEVAEHCRMDYPELRKMHTQIDRGFSLLLENEQKRRWEEQELVKFVEEALLELLKSIKRGNWPEVPEKCFEDEWLVSDDEDDNSSEHVPAAGKGLLTRRHR